ncbi:MAG: hypothetical protein GC137_04090 [Alphaproteobacteria bacterium]|nr:hypothetical protein [Alphaproteobacteria bacterium]
MFSLSRLSLFVIVVFALSACQTSTPNHIPRGYSSYKQVYKSAPGPRVEGIGYDYNPQDNQTVVNDMRYAAKNLVEKLDQELSYSVDAVHLDIAGTGAFYSSFDHLLRNELTQQGYLLSHTSDGFVKVVFSAQEQPFCAGYETEEGEKTYKKLYLALVLHMPYEEAPRIVGGYYDVPAYGFEATPHEQVFVPECFTPHKVPYSLTQEEN